MNRIKIDPIFVVWMEYVKIFEEVERYYKVELKYTDKLIYIEGIVWILYYYLGSPSNIEEAKKKINDILERSSFDYLFKSN